MSDKLHFEVIGEKLQKVFCVTRILFKTKHAEFNIFKFFFDKMCGLTLKCLIHW